MSRQEFEKKLKTNGFFLVRIGKHRVWKNERGDTISVPQGKQIEWRLSRMLELQLKRGLRLYNQVVPEPEESPGYGMHVV